MASISEPFIRRPVGTTLLAIGLFLVGMVLQRRRLFAEAGERRGVWLAVLAGGAAIWAAASLAEARLLPSGGPAMAEYSLQELFIAAFAKQQVFDLRRLEQNVGVSARGQHLTVDRLHQGQRRGARRYSHHPTRLNPKRVSNQHFSHVGDTRIFKHVPAPFFDRAIQ